MPRTANQKPPSKATEPTRPGRIRKTITIMASQSRPELATLLLLMLLTVRASVPQDGAAEAGAGETSRSASSGGELTSKPAGAAARPSLWLQETYIRRPRLPPFLSRYEVRYTTTTFTARRELRATPVLSLSGSRAVGLPGVDAQPTTALASFCP